MTIRTLFLFILVLPIAALAEEGWTLGLGLASTDNYADEPDSAFFPSLQVESKQYMLLPNVSYGWEQWSLGIQGLGWQSKKDATVKTAVTAGYPRSSLRIGSQKGWFRYGANANVDYIDGILATAGLTAGPLKYEQSRGFNERANEFSQKVTLGVPVYINKKAGLTVIANASVEQNNAAFQREDFKLAQLLTEKEYVHTSANLLAFYKMNDRVTLLTSATLTLNDDNLVAEVDALNQYRMNIFTMFSYQFGR